MGVRLEAGREPPTQAARGWRVVGASAEGTSHFATGAGCQDAHRFEAAAGRLVIAVADGAGSATRAREGACHAVDAAIDCLLEGGSASGAMVAARARLEAVAAGEAACCPGALSDLATTLTVAVVDEAEVAVAQIGDGAVVLRCPSGLSLAVVPERSEYLNETRFVTSPTWVTDQRTFAGPAAGFDGVAVATDGLQLLAFDMATDTPHAPFFDPLFAFAASDTATPGELAAFLASPRVNARTDDDKTLVVAVRG